jgi:ATP-binding cassette, subfamily B, bacterial MsbA
MTFNPILLKYTLKHWILVVSTVVLSLVATVFNGVGTVLIIPLLIAFINPDNLLLKNAPNFIRKIFAIFDVFPVETRFFWMFATVLVVLILKHVTNFVCGLLSTYLSLALSRDMRIDSIKILLEVDIDFYVKHKIGDVFNRFMGEINRAVGSIRSYLGLIQIIATSFMYLSILLSISWQLTIMASILGFILAIFNQFFVKRSKKFGEIITLTAKQQTNKLLELLTGIRLIKATGNEAYELESIRVDILDREKAGLDAQTNSAFIGPINEIGGVIIIALIIIAGRNLFNEQLRSLAPILLTYLYVLFRALPLISQLNSTRGNILGNSSAVDVVTDFLRRDNKPFMPNGSIAYQGLQKGIRFEQVRFAYPGHEEFVLKGIDLWMPKGKMIALVGASGAGKSTIADLLPRFYDPVGGRICLDDHDLRDYDLKTLRKAMGIVSQETFLFNSSIRYNVAYGLQDVSDAEIIEATKRANAYEFISKLPEGLDTEIGDRGVRLSGGQKQRLAIARALLRDPDILILDEATSALDTISERLVQEAIDELCRERTTLVIAHRLSTIQKAYQIVVLDKGTVAEIGNHEELLRRGGHYARLHALQFSDNGDSERNTKEAHDRLSYLSYEVRSSLNGLLGSLRLLSDDLLDEANERQELLEESSSSAMRLLNIIEHYESSSIP